ncbi:MAG: ATP-binding cassette domain-containing protein, partial [Actinomycetota bacterium]
MADTEMAETHDETAAESASETNGTEPREVLVSVSGLKKHFPIMKGLLRRQVGAVRAVDDVSFEIRRGETLGLVGESGSGKSTTGRAILQLDPVTAGTVSFDGHELTAMKSGAIRGLRPRMQMVFQNPHASLNPRMTVASIIGEPLREHGTVRGADRDEKIDDLLRIVGLDPVHANRYPHEFSGGQRQ